MQRKIVSFAITTAIFLAIIAIFRPISKPPQKLRDPAPGIKGHYPYTKPKHAPWNPPKPKPPVDDETQADHLIIKSRLENEDLSWMDRLPRNWQRTVLTIDNDFAKLHEGAKRVDRGRVADVYLRWIIENYNKLPEVIVFLPPENQPRTSGQHIRSEIPKLRARSIQSSGFAPLKCPEVEMCEKLVHPFRSPPYEIRTLDEPMGNVWKQIFGDAKMGGEDLAASPSAEFAVSKAQVQKRSVDEYLKAWTWLNRTPMDDDSAGLVLEYLWPFLFGRDALFCPDFKEC
ncbi:DUF3431 domain-containing protein [Pyrenophora tritici-repentis]|uniref:DUF3431 domain containing protein n=1 Tax=Pyrenophora tritici-repentis TaxID=45151 RepID=A0A834RX55_9PLEO|nr:DUF3431 domain containing protein [Pyrenophora tritici-repentis]KAI0579949.1 DUF3431 domain-containing protein [Pyrenophora tritici-repentis]KAI0619569.1 DUF3431 domain-containing protein [Pyrenophora tritici-repentis]